MKKPLDARHGILYASRHAREAGRNLSHVGTYTGMGHKPGFYVVVSRNFIADNDEVSTMVCAPIYGEILALATEVVVGHDRGLPRTSAIRSDVLTLMFKARLTEFVAALAPTKISELNRALAVALDPAGSSTALSSSRSPSRA